MIRNSTDLKLVKKSKPKIVGPKVTVSKVNVRKLGFDGIKHRTAVNLPSRAVLVTKTKTFRPLKHYAVKTERQTIFTKYRLAVGLITLALIFTFGLGFWTAFSTSPSYAEFVYSDEGELISVSKEFSNKLLVQPLIGAGQLPVSAETEDLFSMPLDRLESHFSKKQQKMQAEALKELIKQRTAKIKNYLREKKAPYEGFADVIAVQPHWQLILAISFAESSWGKNCTDNNCSNIGVEPGHALWREYKNYGEWIVDFNSLLERRYKDWTLKDMCGVYVKPCNQNWMKATTQVLGELKENGIE